MFDYVGCVILIVAYALLVELNVLIVLIAYVLYFMLCCYSCFVYWLGLVLW